jgi:hypothetical protein
MPRLSVAELCGASRVTREDGRALRRAIEEHWDAADTLVLDFDDVRIASVSFFDESLGLLARKYPLDDLKRHVRVENMDPADRRLLNDIVLSRSRERRFETEVTSEDSHSRPSDDPTTGPARQRKKKQATDRVR